MHPSHASLRPGVDYPADILIDALYVCRTCTGVYGDVAWVFRGIEQADRRQVCACWSGTRVKPWPNFDFPQAVALCRCCGGRALPSGSSWSMWFCAECAPPIEALNRRYKFPLIPLSRKSLAESIRTTHDRVAAGAIPVATVSTDWFTRVEQLEQHARDVVLRRLADFSRSDREVRLIDYLRLAAVMPVDPQQAFQETASALGLPSSLLDLPARST